MSDIAERLRAITGQAGDLGKTDALTGFDRMPSRDRPAARRERPAAGRDGRGLRALAFTR
jgi:hypothetical protein